jgi:transcriptional regulator of acetoin/glycerol metabolism
MTQPTTDTEQDSPERKALAAAINATGSIDGAAKLVGLSRRTFQRRLRQHNVETRQVIVAR